MENAGGGRLRSAAAGIIGVLAVLVLLVTAIAVWARVTLFDSDKVAGFVGDALAEPEVDAALAARVAEQVFMAVDVGAFVDDVLPDALDRLQPAITGGIETAVQRGLTTLFENPEVQDLVTNLVRRAHAAAMRLLEGDGLVDGITVVDGEVTLNLLPLIGRGITRLQDFGLLSDLDLPTLTADGEPADQIAELETALDRDLPDGFGQLVVYRSDQIADAQASLDTAQRLLVVSKRGLWVLIAVSVVLLALTILVARHRWRAALLLGLGGVVAMVLARSAVRRVRDDAPELVTRPGAKAAITSILDDAASGLLRVFGIVLVVAAVVAIVAFLRRRHQREDLILIGSVLAGAVVLGLLGFSIVSLVVGVAVAVLVWFGARWVWPAPEEAPTARA